MDKETLSNYGWIVILVLILAVMIALATPFGNFIAGAIKSTTAGFFSVNQNAMNAGGITIPGQNFDDTLDETPVPIVGCATFTDGVTLTWEELKSGRNDSKYVYDASRITDMAIGDFAFQTSYPLLSITIPEGVTSIGYGAFSDCSSLSSITIPEGVTSIGDSAFMFCSSLASITIPGSVENINSGTFQDCSSLTDVTISVGVTFIDNRAFSRCRALTNITYEGTKAQWNAITESYWCTGNMGYITVTCTDGTITIPTEY